MSDLGGVAFDDDFRETDFGEVPEIWADSNQLQEALFHLVQNAEQAALMALIRTVVC